MIGLDPVVLRERIEKHNDRQKRSQRAIGALAALSWFERYALIPQADGQRGPREVHAAALVPGEGSNKGPSLIVATSTPDAVQAAHFVKQAYIEYRSAILERAIELAHKELNRNEDQQL